MAGTIYTWGYGEMFYEILLAVSAFSNDGYLIKIAGGLGMLTLMFKLLDGRSPPILAAGKFFLLTVFVYVAFMTAGSGGVYRHTVQDQVTGFTNVVDGVPIGVGKTLELVTGMELAIADGMETAFSTPNSTQYRNAGLGFPLVAHSNMAKMHSIDPFVQKSLDDYIANCLMFDMMDGTLNPNTIFNSGDIASSIVSTSNRMSNIYSATNPGGQLMTCQAASSQLPLQVNGMLTKIKTIVAAQSGFMTGGNTATFDNKAADVASLYFGVSKTSTEYLRQSVMMNMMSDGLNNVAKTSGIDPAALAYGTAMAERSAQSNFAVSGELAKKYLPLLKGILTMMIVSIAWMLAILAVMFFDVAYITMFLTLMIFLSLWTPLAVVLNFITSLYLEKTLTPMGAVGGWYTMANKPIIDSEVMSTLAWLGYLGWSIPMLAYAIAKKSDHGFVSLTSGLTSAMGSSAGQAAGEMARGNIRLGAVSLGKQESYQDGSSYTVGQKGTESNRAVNQEGTQFQEKTTTANGVKTTENTSATGSGAVQNDGGEIVAAKVNGVGANANASFKDSAGQALEEVSGKQRAQEKTIGQATEAALSSTATTVDAKAASAGKGMTVADKTALQTVKSKAYEELDSQTKDAMKSTMETSGFGAQAGVGFSKGLKLGASGKWEWSSTDGHSVKFSDSASSKMSDSVSKVSSREFTENKDFREALTHSEESRNSIASSGKYTDADSLKKSYTQTLSEKDSLTKTKEEGLNLTSDKSIALIAQGSREAMEANHIQEHGGTPEQAQKAVDEQIKKQGGVFSQEQIRQGINHIDAEVREANNGQAGGLMKTMQAATKPYNPTEGTVFKDENSFKPVAKEVQNRLNEGEDQAKNNQQKQNELTDDSKNKVDTSGINSRKFELMSTGDEIKNSPISNSKADKVKAGVANSISTIAGNVDEAGDRAKTLAAAAGITYGAKLISDTVEKFYKQPEAQQKPGGETGEKLQGAKTEAEENAKKAEAAHEKNLKSTPQQHAQSQMSNVLEHEMAGAKKAGDTTKFNNLSRLNDQVKGGHNVSMEKLKDAGGDRLINELKASDIKFNTHKGTTMLEESGNSLYKESVDASAKKMMSAEVASQVASDSFQQHTNNPNVTPNETRGSFREKVTGFVDKAAAKLDDMAYKAGRAVGVEHSTLANVGSGIQNAINSPTAANIANLAKGAGVGVLISGFGDLGNPEAGTPMDESARMESQKAFLKANPSFNPKEQKLQPHWNGGGFDFTIVDRKSTALGPKS